MLFFSLQSNLSAYSLKSVSEEKPSTGYYIQENPVGWGKAEIHRIRDHERIFFEVSDTGIGISKSKIDDLFESFVLGDASFSRKYGGTGLGLPLSRGLIHKMGGEIYVESEENRGSKISFTLPIEFDRDETGEKNFENSKKTQREKKSIENSLLLVVEDNRINRIVAGEILKQAGFKFDFAENGLEACEAVNKKAYDLILMDCQMPILDGFEATANGIGRRRMASKTHGSCP